MKRTILKAGLLMLVAAVGTTAGAQTPEPVYLLDFEGATSVTDFGGIQHGSGSLMTSEDSSIGTYYQNWSNATSGGSSIFTNFLEVVPTTNPWAAIKATGSNAFTVSFWCNAKLANSLSISNYWGSLFTGYTAAGTATGREWYYQLGPDLRYAGQFHYNNYGYADDNHDDFKDDVATWDDNNNLWHHFAWVFSGMGSATEFTLTLYIDGVQQYSAVEAVTGANTTAFDMLNDLDRFVIGGASPIWADPDNAFAYDDIALYASALTATEVKSIITAKNIKTVIGNEDNTSGWWTAFSDYYTIEENQTLTLEFDNYSAKGGNYQNWLVVVTNDKARGEDGYAEYIVLRADNYGWQYGLNTGPDSSHDWYYLLASNYNWDNFVDEMNGSHVVMTIARGGNVTDIYADITASSGTKYFEHFVLPCGDDGTAKLRAFLTLENAHLLLDDSKTTVTDTKITGTITASGYNSFSSYFPLNLTGIKAYKITGVDNANKVVMSEVTGSVPAQTGLLLEGTAGADFTLLPTSAATTAPAGNLLVALPNGGQVAKAESGTNYVFGWEDASKPGFFRVNDVLPTLGAGKAYLHVPAAEAPFLSIDLGGETTGVKSLTPTLSQEEGAYYTLDGRRVSQPTKGLYIVNGKKVMVK